MHCLIVCDIIKCVSHLHPKDHQTSSASMIKKNFDPPRKIKSTNIDFPLQKSNGPPIFPHPPNKNDCSPQEHPKKTSQKNIPRKTSQKNIPKSSQGTRLCVSPHTPSWHLRVSTPPWPRPTSRPRKPTAPRAPETVATNRRGRGPGTGRLERPRVTDDGWRSRWISMGWAKVNRTIFVVTNKVFFFHMKPSV